MILNIFLLQSKHKILCFLWGKSSFLNLIVKPKLVFPALHQFEILTFLFWLCQYSDWWPVVNDAPELLGDPEVFLNQQKMVTLYSVQLLAFLVCFIARSSQKPGVPWKLQFAAESLRGSLKVQISQPHLLEIWLSRKVMTKNLHFKNHSGLYFQKAPQVILIYNQVWEPLLHCFEILKWLSL